MTRKTIARKVIVAAGWILVSGLALAQGDQLPLRHGTYVLNGVACKQPPFAAMMSWDGVGFSGPHSSKCKSRIANGGHEWELSTTCTAFGDGSPDTSGHVDNFSLTRLSNTRFSIRKAGGTQETYRWCNAQTTNVPKDTQ